MVHGDEEEETPIENTRRFVRQATQEIVDEVHKKTDRIGIEITEPNHHVIHHREILTPGGTRQRRKSIMV